MKLKKITDMKTLKQITLLSGIILGILIIFGQTSLANVKEYKSAKEQQKTALNLNHQQLQAVEFELIENYLEENPVKENLVQQANIYTVDGECVYKGEKEKATDLIEKSDILFEKGNTTYYITTK